MTVKTTILSSNSTSKKCPKLLLCNPNSTKSMTDSLIPLISEITSELPHFFTSPTGPVSINDSNDCRSSAEETLPHLIPLLSQYDGFLICCYSDHPLVQQLRELTSKPVIGIFEASISTSLLLLPSNSTFGIISTGKIWESLLTDAVTKYLGVEGSNKFAGVETCGLSAIELHDTEPTEVRKQMKEATKRLVRKGNVKVICMGCAGMAGMEDLIREACVEELGESNGELIRIVDGVKVGYTLLKSLVDCGY